MSSLLPVNVSPVEDKFVPVIFSIEVKMSIPALTPFAFPTEILTITEDDSKL